MTDISDFVRDHFKISFDDPDKDGKVTATFSFVDMVALTKRVQHWCGRVLALMEASGVPGLSIDADRALPLFLNGTAPESAAVLLIAEARAIRDVPATDVRARFQWSAVEPAALHRAPVEVADAHRAEAWEGTDLVTHLRSWPSAPPDTDAFSAAYAGDLMQKAADEIEHLRTSLAQWDRPISAA